MVLSCPMVKTNQPTLLNFSIPYFPNILPIIVKYTIFFLSWDPFKMCFANHDYVSKHFGNSSLAQTPHLCMENRNFEGGALSRSGQEPRYPA